MTVCILSPPHLIAHTQTHPPHSHNSLHPTCHQFWAIVTEPHHLLIAVCSGSKISLHWAIFFQAKVSQFLHTISTPSYSSTMYIADWGGKESSRKASLKTFTQCLPELATWRGYPPITHVHGVKWPSLLQWYALVEKGQQKNLNNELFFGRVSFSV